MTAQPTARASSCGKPICKSSLGGNGANTVKLVLHEKNKGKGAGVRSGLEQVSGELVLIQDADLEYDPRDYPALIAPILEGHADAVFGNRFHYRAAPRTALLALRAQPHRSRCYATCLPASAFMT